jgi:transcriptional regulator with XRE-family HTH domain
VDTLGKRIARARERTGWSQNRLEKEARISEGGVSRFERDERAPSAGSLRKIAAKLGVRADWLLTGAPPMEAAEALAAGTDPLPNRTLAAQLARDDGVYEAAIQSVVAEPADDRALRRTVLWWADRMRLRQREMIDATRDVTRDTTPVTESGQRKTR